MINPTAYLIQLVGFSTTLGQADFMRRWIPFAQHFKSQGIISIDLFRVQQPNALTYLSRNIWEEHNYLLHFPTGMPGSGSGGGISVTQFGAYRIPLEPLESPKEMCLQFLPESAPPTDAHPLTCLRITEQVPFAQVRIWKDGHLPSPNTQSNTLSCTHLTRL